MSDTRPKYTLPSFGLIDINKKKKEKEAAAAKDKDKEVQSGDILAIRQRQKQKDAKFARLSRKDRYDFAEGGPGEGTGGVPIKKNNASGSRPSGPKHRNPFKAKPSSEAPAASGAPPKPKLRPVAATDKSSQAGKMTSFQRMKARQFEKEGAAGRSMTAAQAKRKASEKGSSVAGLRSLFGLSKVKSAPDKKSLSSEFRKKNLAANQKIGKKQ